MKRRRLALGTLAALALAALAACLVVALLPASPEREKFDRVQVGMSKKEVYRILGPDMLGPTPMPFGSTAVEETRYWAVDDAEIVVDFGRDGSVTTKRFESRSWFAAARDWLAAKLGL